MKRLFLGFIGFYRKFLSPLKGRPCCRFTPSCSLYGYKAINEWGVVVGTLLFTWRILRCNPFCRGGEDGIPHRKRKPIPNTEKYTKRIKPKEPYYFCYVI